MIHIPSLLRRHLPSPKVTTLSLLTLCASHFSQAADYYFLPNSAGANNGTSFDNAYGWSDFGVTGIADFLNNTMGPGDRLMIGSGTFDGQKLTISTSGTASSPKEIVGMDTGSGLPLLTKGTWSASSPGSGNHSLIQFDTAGVHYWKISGLKLQGAQYAIYSPNTSAACTNIHLSDIQISEVRHGLYVSNLDSSTLENVVVTHYTKHAFRLEKGCNQLEFINCMADLSNGDSSWWDDSESIPFGFNVLGTSGAPNTNITFTGCVSMNNRRNGQGSSNYWNGDGFSVENVNSAISFVGCLAFGNDDAGFDVKPDAAFEDCVAFDNKRNFRSWYASPTYTNCIAGYAAKRGGTGSVTGFWIKDGAGIYDHCTVHADAGYGLHEDGSGSALVTNSILSFTGASGSYSSGNVTLDGSTTTYRPGSGSNPDYINASPFWDGTGNDFNSQTYGASKGYYVAEGDLILDSEDNSGISISGNWSSSTGASGYHGNHYLHDGDSGQGSKSVRYTPTLPASAFYEVLANWTEHSNRASNAPINITHKNGTDYLSVNQRSNGGQWVSLGIYGFNSGSSGNVLIHNTGANGYVVADAVKFVAIPAAEVTLDSEDSSGITFTGTWLSSTSKEGYQGSHYMHDNDSNNYKSVLYTPEIPVSGSYEVFAIWTADTNRASTVPIDISHDGGIDYVSVNQQSNGGQWVSLGTYDFAAGTSGTILIHNTGSNGYVIADGLKLVQQP